MIISTSTIKNKIRLMFSNSKNFVPNSIPFQKMYWANTIKNYRGQNKIFGYDWGDPKENNTKDSNGVNLGNYLFIKNHHLLPNIRNAVVLDIGSGGGKWTQYMKPAHEIICVDLSDEALDYIKKKLGWKKIKYYKTSGDELSGVPDSSVDFVFSMDCLVRCPRVIIKSYFSEINRILKPGGKICLHLPCQESIGSEMRKFVKISSEDIRRFCKNNKLKVFTIDQNIITHGVILTAQKYV